MKVCKEKGEIEKCDFGVKAFLLQFFGFLNGMITACQTWLCKYFEEKGSWVTSSSGVARLHWLAKIFKRSHFWCSVCTFRSPSSWCSDQTRRIRTKVPMSGRDAWRWLARRIVWAFQVKWLALNGLLVTVQMSCSSRLLKEVQLVFDGMLLCVLNVLGFLVSLTCYGRWNWSEDKYTCTNCWECKFDGYMRCVRRLLYL